MRRVIVESPYAAETEDGIRTHIGYARACIRDCLLRGEAPIASHLLYTQEGILDDRIPEERLLGMNAGWAWIKSANVMAVYMDHGISNGMKSAIKLAEGFDIPIEYRTLAKDAEYRAA